MNYTEFLKQYNVYEEIAKRFLNKYNDNYTVNDIYFDTGGMRITCDEYWSHGGYAEHSLTLPMEHFDDPEGYATGILTEEKRIARENERKEQERKLKQEKALFDKLKKKYEP